MSSKYTPLAKYLEEKDQDMLRMSFIEIDNIIGGLPPGSLKHRAWWSNNITHTHTRHGWLAAGWKTSKVDMDKKELVFVRGTKQELGAINQEYFLLPKRPERRRYSGAASNARLAEIVRNAGGIENLNEVARAIQQYIDGDLLETELGRILRKIWPRVP